MANSKISALTSASTVVGTEVLPIVQSSATVKVSVANLTPGLNTITAAKGGTGQTSYAVGDLIYADTTSTLAKLADVATGNALISGGVSTAPSWGKIALTTHVSGVLPIANGGTNASTSSITSFNNITGYTASGATGTTSTNLVFSTSPSITTPTLVGDATLSTGNVSISTSGKGITTGSSISLGLGTNGSTTQVTINTSGDTALTSVTDATSTTAASLKTAGGLAVAKKSFLGDTLSVTGPTTSTPVNGILQQNGSTSGPYGNQVATDHGFISDNTATSILRFSVPNNTDLAAFYTVQYLVNANLGAYYRIGTKYIGVTRKSGGNILTTIGDVLAQQTLNNGGQAITVCTFAMGNLQGAVSATQTIDLQITLSDGGNGGYCRLLAIGQSTFYRSPNTNGNITVTGV